MKHFESSNRPIASTTAVIYQNYTEVLGGLAASLDPARLEDLGEGLMDMYWNEQPDVSFIKRREITIATYGVRDCIELGDLVIRLTNAKLRLSSLLDINWQSSFDNNRQVVVRASPNLTDKRYPAITVIEGVKPSTIVNGRVLPIKEPSALHHIQNFQHDLSSTETIVNNWRNRPPQQPIGSTNWHCVKGVWQQIKK